MFLNLEADSIPEVAVHKGTARRHGFSLSQVAAVVAAGATWLISSVLLEAGFAQPACLVLCVSGLVLSKLLSSVTDKHSAQNRLLRIFTAPSFRVISVTSLVALDVMFYSFPLPFLPDLFISFGKENSDIAFLASTYSYSALLTGIGLLVFQGFQGKELVDRDCWRALAVAASLMTAISFAQAAYPSYTLFFITRCLQGIVSQFCWSYALALGMRLPALFGASCVAWISSGESVGELAGPWFGSVLYQLGGVRCPFAVASFFMLLTACLLTTLAVSREVWSNSRPQAVSDSSAESKPQSQASGFSVLKLPRVARLCGLLVLACAMARGALDVFVPMHLNEVFIVSPGGIGQVFGFGTVCYLLGSMLGGRGFTTSVPLQMRAWAMLIAHACMSIAMIFVLRAGSSNALACNFSLFLGSSALVNVSVNTQLEEVGSQHGGTDSLATLSVLSWSIGFALGGVVTQVAAGSAGARMAALTCIGMLNIAWLIWSAILDRGILYGNRSVSISEQIALSP